MKTITVKGKVYQIDEPYRSVDDGRMGYLFGDGVSKHDGRFCLSVNPSTYHGGEVFFCAQIEPFISGTIKDVPLELEDGEWYMCEQIACPGNVGHKTCLFYRDGNLTDAELKSGRGLDMSKSYSPIYKMVKA